MVFCIDGMLLASECGSSGQIFIRAWACVVGEVAEDQADQTIFQGYIHYFLD
jgi:hypothetical protein